MRLFSFCKTREIASTLAISFILIGIFAMIYWPTDLKYEKTTVAVAKIKPDGKWIELEGKATKINPKTNGASVNLCSDKNDCISVYFSKKLQLEYLKGAMLKVRGEISQIGTNKFLSGHTFEVIG